MKKALFFLVIITIILFSTIFISGCTNTNNSETSATETTNIATTASSETEATTVNSSEKITKEKAEDIALKDAGFTLENATVKTIKKDIEDGKEVFEIEFEADNYEYDYLIDAATGAVMHATREQKDNSVVTATTNAGSKEITLNEAKQIALNHAGTPEGSATFTKEKLDTDDGNKIYEIDFTSGNTEYEYDIDAKTGKIISSEKDTEKVSATTSNSSDNQTSVLIPSSQAVRIALVDAGVKESDATIEPVDLDAEDGVQYYDVTFRKGNIEYEYEINAKTGEIISADKN